MIVCLTHRDFGTMFLLLVCALTVTAALGATPRRSESYDNEEMYGDITPFSGAEVRNFLSTTLGSNM
jgi:hypothetical protein